MQITFILELAVRFLIPLLTVLTAIYLGKRYGTYSIKKSPELQQSAVGSVVGAVFGLLAFILAFTFQIAANHYDARKTMLLKEVTDIRTIYLRAGLIDEPICSGTKKLLVEYVDQRVELTGNFSNLSLVQARSQQIFDTLWSYAELLAKRDRSSEVYSLYTASVNDLIDNYNQRVTFALEYRIPVAIYYALFVIIFFSMFVLGYQFGISGKGSLNVNVAMAIIFAVVMLLIAALDRPELGLIKINQKPLFTLQTQLHMKQVH
jgi:hypothetical protein